ncbi:Asp23/Gls24 family envelope stress response protein [Georgenia thermotolerans]|uniref:Asp23/Gls24 family envelope stress response protein n=1 Tax=Georgenia thermotolerans TaxID=527326 RepID=A0A7J5UT29_9MICO|nr:Asp23/Gls24 family envelope stress response protein [Georgenia thermotolerans]KAE8765470.1 Asp23/Gls24 family envelope stress response protein [Georgenia thermotolerans]
MAEQRGEVRVADRVVERIVRTAVLQVDGVAPEGSTTGAIGSALGRTYPRVDCTVAGDHVRVSVEIETLWPASAARVAGEVQDAVADQLERFAGLRADVVHVLVARVAPAAQELRRVQ